MRAFLSLLSQWSRAQRPRFSHCVIALLFCTGGASASALYTGTVASDVQSASFGSSQTTRALGAAADGTIYVGFFSADGTQIRVARSTDRGATFSPSVIADTAAVGKTFATASLAVSPAGAVFVAYEDSSSNVFLARSTNSGVTFAALAVSADGTSLEVTVFVSPTAPIGTWPVSVVGPNGASPITPATFIEIVP